MTDTSKKARELELIREFERLNFKHVNFEYHDEENFAYQNDVVKAIVELIDLRETYEHALERIEKLRAALAHISGEPEAPCEICGDYQQTDGEILKHYNKITDKALEEDDQAAIQAKDAK